MCNPGAGRLFGTHQLAVGLCVGLSVMAAAGDASAANTFGSRYGGASTVGSDQVQVVYYRPEAGAGQGVANVYLDREFVTALRPGGHVAFCVAPGRHLLGAYLDDAPRYPGKNEELYAANFNGGSTYYVKVREEGGNQPLPVSRRTAATDLENSRQQIHLLSRASKVQVCRHYPSLDAPVTDLREFSLQADASFNSRDGLNEAGRQQLQQMLEQLRQDGAQISRVEVEGHTDPSASTAANQLQGQRMADAVRAALIERGVPQSMVTAVSAGSRSLVKLGCLGSTQEQRSCNAPNRRVVLRVEMKTR